MDVLNIAGGHHLDRDILLLLYEAGGAGLLPKDLTAKLAVYKVRRYQVSRRIQRINKRIGERDW
jgi:hypothetical protein